MGHRLTRIESPQGFTAETSAVAVLLTAAQGGLPLSTTHITAGAVLGSGLGRRGAGVRWRVAGSMLIAWMLTLPAAGLIAGGICLIVVDGGLWPIVIVSVAAVALLLGFWLWSRRDPVGADNINDSADSFGRVNAIERPVLEQAAG
jgi:PiT family inorganic phosphate transporter